VTARILGAVTGAAAVVAVMLVAQSGGHGDTRRAVHPLPKAVSPAGLVATSGVRVVRVATTGGGGLVDLRYQVVDPDAAAAVHDAKSPPAVVNEATGAVVDRLFMGHSHHGPAKAGVTYYLVLDNVGDAIRRGDRVAVVLGPARVEHVLVR
jgi:hypothetical protein